MPGGGPASRPEPAAPSGPAAPEISDVATAPAQRTTRAQNRAAKRAASGVRAKGVVRGRVQGRKQRGYSPAVIGLAITAFLVVIGVLIIGNPFGSPGPSASPGFTGSIYGDGTCPTSQPAALPAGQTRYVTIETEKGNIVIKVDGSLSPIAAGNFVALVDCEYYDGVVFHRTAALGDGTPFVIQGGDPDGTGSGPGPGYSISDEAVTATYHRGTVAMARTSQPNSQGSQFFIVLDDKAVTALAAANTYAIFGEVISGMDVADAIFQASAGEELPVDPVVMDRVSVSASPPATAAPTAAPTQASTPGAPTPTPGASPGATP
jgi:peptidyl-prolyl cis-trans isomerase B (cyclophilin B)